MIPKIVIHLSVCFLAYFLIEINTGTSPVLDENSFSTFWRHFWNVCQSVSWLDSLPN